MSQTIVLDHPPIYDELAAVFRIWDRRDVVFSWGDRIYNPYDVYIPPAILAHEAIHGHRQGSREQDIRDWWARYMDGHQFRLAEELHAHRAEYVYLMRNAPRNERRRALKLVSGKLASPLYGRMLRPSDARRMIAAALDS